jgi:hypothetical protein
MPTWLDSNSDQGQSGKQIRAQLFALGTNRPANAMKPDEKDPTNS